ncbi:patatin-like phospholipase family protein [Flavobacterium litorale]|uniref:Patatin-like phospholipase family protein n=1 Tax=Flavobacterium litorale TaxID=2856519 RepID=A0ABX8VAB8_9FLAO|nr:patatin-like phospholipase family protein [Flavobacterium litorale]QYJ69482.1 patatin-like phospholipase family protein [Flavobacterium litorale]
MKFKDSTIGITLSGGGTKGIAHAGALKFFEEENIVPHHLAGTSSGAIVAALYAWGKKPEEILDFFRSIYFFHWKHFTFRKAGFIDADAFKNYFKPVFKDATIGDSPFRLHITATNIVSGKLHVFPPEVKILDAILASAAFPGIIAPYEINGKLYSDGGILNHFPTDILQGRCETLIGVYLGPMQKVEASDLKNIKSVVARAYDLLSANSNMHKSMLCDWVISPNNLAPYNTFETNKVKMGEIFDIGYEAAKKSYAELII